MGQLWRWLGAAPRGTRWLVLALLVLPLCAMAIAASLGGLGVVGHLPADWVAGTYGVDHGKAGYEELLLSRDGTYRQMLQTANGARYESAGRWAVAHRGAGTQVVIRQFTSWVDAWEMEMLPAPLVGDLEADLRTELGFCRVLHVHEGLRYQRVR